MVWAVTRVGRGVGCDVWLTDDSCPTRYLGAADHDETRARSRSLSCGTRFLSPGGRLMRLLVTALVASGLIFMVGAADAAGCLKGAAVGGVAGHFAGHHGVLGAVAGCAIGHHEASKQRKLEQQNSDAPQPK